MIYTDGDWYEGDWVDDLSYITVILQNMETENMYIVMEPYIKENGKMIFKMGLDKNNLLTDPNIRDSLKMARRMDLVILSGQMVKVMKEILNPITFVDLGIKFSYINQKIYMDRWKII